MSLKIHLEYVEDEKSAAEVVLCSRLADAVTTDGGALKALMQFARQAGEEFGVDVFVRDDEGHLLYWWTARTV